MMQPLPPPDRQNAGLDLAAALEAFEPITLDDLKGSDANLLDRTETTFLMTADRFVQILSDLRERTGLDVVRCEVERIDFLRDTAEISVYYAGGPTEKK